MSFWDGNRWMRDVPADTTPSPPPRRRRFIGAAAEALLITALIFGLIAGTALAAKGGNGGGKGGGNKPNGDGSSSLSLMMVDPNDAVANRGDKVTFAVATTATEKPWVALKCYQDGVWVYVASHGFFDTYLWEPNFTLSSSAWTDGAADCNAELYTVTSNGRSRTLATLSFYVQP